MVAAILGGMIAAPQIVGMADTVLRSLRDEPGFWWHTYRRTWKINARASLIPGAVFGLIFGGEIFLYTHLASMQAGTGNHHHCCCWRFCCRWGCPLHLGPDCPAESAVFYHSEKRNVPVSRLSAGQSGRHGGAGGLLGCGGAAVPHLLPGAAADQLLAADVPSLLIVYTALDKSFEIEKTLKEQQEESAESNS